MPTNVFTMCYSSVDVGTALVFGLVLGGILVFKYLK